MRCLTILFALVLVSCSGDDFGPDRAIFEQNGHLDRIGDSCFIRMTVDQATMSAPGSRWTRYFHEVVSAESFKFGQPEFAPVLRNTELVFYGECIPESVTGPDWSLDLVSQDDYLAIVRANEEELNVR